MNELQLANEALDQDDLDKSVYYLEIYCKQNPSRGLYRMLAQIHRKRGDLDKSKYYFTKALSFDRKNIALYLDLALLCEPIMKNNETISQTRSNIQNQIRALHKNKHKLVMHDPKDIAYLNFYGVYHGQNEHEINTLMMDILTSAFPRFLFDAVEQKISKKPQEKIKIGFLSTYLRHHTIGRLFSSLLMKLSDTYFEKVLITTREDCDTLTQELAKNCAKHIFITRDISLAQLQIQKENLDMLFYPEIGMDVFIHLLSLSRLATIQMVTWGHPVTTGSPNIDFFLLPEHMISKHEIFCETVVPLPTPNIFYKEIHPQNNDDIVKKYDIPQGHLYACPQTLYKFHPDYIPVFAGILQKDPKAIFVLSQASSPYWSQQLLEIWKEHIPNIEDHIFWLPLISRDEFIQILSICDVMIDPFPFGGGNTVLEAFSVDLPVVTLPTEYARCRIAMTLYETMQYTELVAQDIEEYVQRAIQVATDPDKSYKKTIHEKKHVLFENEDFVQEFQNTLLQIWNNKIKTTA